MRGLTVLLLLCLSVTACRPRDKIRVESPQAENLSSTVNAADPTVASQLIKGFHQIEQGSWRWTAGQFSVVLKPPAGATAGGRVVLRCTVPDPLLSRVKTVTLTAKVNGGVLGFQTWTSPGEYTFSAPVPAAQLETDAVTIDFSLDKFLAAGVADSRELGLIVNSVALEPAS